MGGVVYPPWVTTLSCGPLYPVRRCSGGNADCLATDSLAGHGITRRHAAEPLPATLGA